MRRLLFLAIHPKEVASTRYRVLAYLPRFKQEGFEPVFVSFFTSDSLSDLASRGRWARKIKHLWRGFWKFQKALDSGPYSAVFIHRELFPFNFRLGTRLLAGKIRRLGYPVIYDLDDAVYLRHRQGRGFFSWFENPQSIQDLFRMSRLTIAGNEQLAAYARRFCARVETLPTPVDTAQFAPRKQDVPQEPLTIGWIGSPTTAKYLNDLQPVFRQLQQEHAFRVKIVGAGRRFSFDPVQVECRDWRLETESEEFGSCDIGVYPLWNDPWAQGKCGFKALEFMACGVPVVASAVGINREIVQDGANGFLIAKPEEWVKRLSQLLQDAQLRRRLGDAGRQTVESKYSLKCAGGRLVQWVNEIAGKESSR